MNFNTLKLKIVFWALSVGPWPLDTGHWPLDIECFECWINKGIKMFLMLQNWKLLLGTGHWPLDIGHSFLMFILWRFIFCIQVSIGVLHVVVNDFVLSSILLFNALFLTIVFFMLFKSLRTQLIAWELLFVKFIFQLNRISLNWMIDLIVCAFSAVHANDCFYFDFRIITAASLCCSSIVQLQFIFYCLCCVAAWFIFFE